MTELVSILGLMLFIFLLCGFIDIIVCIISEVLISSFERRKKQKEYKMYRPLHERQELVDEVIHFDSRVEYARSLSRRRYNALQKIKAICGHLGVRVDIRYPDMSPSIDTIRSLSFMKEYLPEIEEQWQIYQNTDPCSVLYEIKKKEIDILHELEKVPAGLWDHASEEQRRDCIQNLSNEYDRKEIMKEDSQVNLATH